MASSRQDNRQWLQPLAEANGADMFGVADTSQLRHTFELPGGVTDVLPLAVVMGVGVLDTVLATLDGGPNQLYLHHYRQLNYLLDRLALQVARFIHGRGFQALPVAASQIVDWDRQTAHVSHKHLAQRAGLGWIGRNNLLVNRQWGSRVRLVSVLTDLPFNPDGVLAGGCAGCRRCRDACPAGAIADKPEDFDHLGCFTQLQEFRKSRGVGQYICGLCVQACPGGCGEWEQPGPQAE